MLLECISKFCDIFIRCTYHVHGNYNDTIRVNTYRFDINNIYFTANNRTTNIYCICAFCVHYSKSIFCLYVQSTELISFEYSSVHILYVLQIFNLAKTMYAQSWFPSRLFYSIKTQLLFRTTMRESRTRRQRLSFDILIIRSNNS